jgi:hypothetical protein
MLFAFENEPAPVTKTLKFCKQALGHQIIKFRARIRFLGTK